MSVVTIEKPENVYRHLYVGDPHAEASSIDELWSLINYIYEVAESANVDSVIFLGDQYHTHSILHLSVVDFWLKAIDKLNKLNKDLVFLVGNHDKPGYDLAGMNAMNIHERVTAGSSTQGVNMVVSDHCWYNGLLFVGYQFSHEKFIEICNKAEYKDLHTVICHQTFFGSQYENGFYAPVNDSINPDLIPQKQIISGHIHTAQKFGKVTYLGSPRWRTISDANQEKYIWVYDHDMESGKTLAKYPFSVSGVCKPIYHIEENPDHEITELKPEWSNGTTYIDLYGDFKFIAKKKELYAGLGFKVRTFPTQTKGLKIKESEGIGNSFVKFIGNFKPKNNTPLSKLLEMANDRIMKDI